MYDILRQLFNPFLCVLYSISCFLSLVSLKASSIKIFSAICSQQSAFLNACCGVLEEYIWWNNYTQWVKDRESANNKPYGTINWIWKIESRLIDKFLSHCELLRVCLYRVQFALQHWIAQEKTRNVYRKYCI